MRNNFKLIAFFAVILLAVASCKEKANKDKNAATENGEYKGVIFEKTSFNEALSKAKRENKMVFLDCYTSWCGPCKVLMKKVFPKKEVGDYFNENFICIKRDMEIGEGPELGKRFNVVGYPTLLFLDSNGKVIHRITSAFDSEKLLSEAKKAVNPNERMDGLAKQIENGNRDIDILMKYISILMNKGETDKGVLAGYKYISDLSNEDILNEKYFNILKSIGVEYKGSHYYYIVKNREKFDTSFGKNQVDMVLTSSSYFYINQLCKTGPLERLKEEIKGLASKNSIFANVDFELISKYYIHHKQHDEWLKYQLEESKKIKDVKKSSEILSSAAVKIYKDKNFADMQDRCNTAIMLLNKSKKMYPKADYIDFLKSQCYCIFKQKKKAEMHLNKYLEILKEKSIKPGDKVLALERRINEL